MGGAAEGRVRWGVVFGEVDWWGWCVLGLVGGWLSEGVVCSAVRVVVQVIG